MSGAKTQTVDLEDLPLQSLQQVKSQLEEELSQLTSSYSQLKQAQSTFRDCKECVETLKPENSGKTILIPLTNSLYVPGTLGNVSNVIIDVGTGYYVEKSTQDAHSFYQGKVDYLQNNLDKLQETVTGKQNNLRVLVDVMNSKISKLQAEKEATKSS
ncbi:Prefoldin-domain-containing protein [Basidiobolus meristosporus CBS 931.73]|uniref:Prefoldin-domain-containing protein n=1 Tax=Basidiobolus meristosporus CBS 931.73 TaxID=1314790 RepID=A0A1Y1ZC70_9FUNG|nr:Prefoldin-domain-containing protein [Basidiobolus meristosporus CBS 931.73]|eukprot:ORY07870.1 Prefoldin-domain-containing protein [Basidiobolus meristosporus CBS 931.73]